MQQASPEWSRWLVAQRRAIDRILAERLAADLPGPSTPESEALRRFRSHAAAALRRGGAPPPPSLDGVRGDAQRAGRLIEVWCDAAAQLAGPQGGELRGWLEPLLPPFRAALLQTGAASRARRTVKMGRRTVTSAIDRVGDAYLAVDLETGEVADANPAATALLGTERVDLLGSRAERWLHGDSRDTWRAHLEALVESPEPRRFRAVWMDSLARPLAVEISATRHAARSRPLALLLARTL